MPPQTSVPLVQAAALMPPSGVPGREVRGTGLSLLLPHFHPTFVQAPCFIIAGLKTRQSAVPAAAKSLQSCPTLCDPIENLQKSKDHLSLKVLISN